MNLQEANELLKTKITEEQLQELNSLYILLDLDKKVFCKIVDAATVETLIHKERHYDRLLKASDEFTAKERYIDALSKKMDLEQEMKNVQYIIDNFQHI